jgi:hypothetical protein
MMGKLRARCTDDGGGRGPLGEMYEQRGAIGEVYR